MTVSVVDTVVLRHLVLGAALGVVGAWAGSRVFESVLFGVEPTDPLTALRAE